MSNQSEAYVFGRVSKGDWVQVGVMGSSTITDVATVERVLDGVVKQVQDTGGRPMLVTGDTQGVDRIVRNYAAERSYPVAVFHGVGNVDPQRARDSISFCKLVPPSPFSPPFLPSPFSSSLFLSMAPSSLPPFVF